MADAGSEFQTDGAAHPRWTGPPLSLALAPRVGWSAGQVGRHITFWSK